MTAGGIFASHPLLRGVAATAATIAVAADTLAGEHPTHSLVLVLVVAVITGLQRYLAPRSTLAVPAVSIALAAQPGLHLISKIGQPIPVAHDHGGLLHVVASEAPTASMQIVVPVLVLVAATIGVQLLYLLSIAVRRPVVATPAPVAMRSPTVSPTSSRLGSMLRWCGWAIRAARRGPPNAPGRLIHRLRPRHRSATVEHDRSGTIRGPRSAHCV